MSRSPSRRLCETQAALEALLARVRGLTVAEATLRNALLTHTCASSGAYSLNTRHAAIRHISNIEATAASLSAKLGHAVNVFRFGRHQFVGFEYRRRDYVRDESAGVNPITKLISRGVYD